MKNVRDNSLVTELQVDNKILASTPFPMVSSPPSEKPHQSHSSLPCSTTSTTSTMMTEVDNIKPENDRLTSEKRESMHIGENEF